MIKIQFLLLSSFKLFFVANYTSLLWVFAGRYVIILELNRTICKSCVVNQMQIFRMPTPLHKHETPTEDFLSTVLPKLCPQVVLNNNEIGKNENYDILL